MSFDLLIELGWKSSLACAVALFASHALRGRPAAQRVAMLRAGVVALLLLPLLILTVPALEIAVLPASAPMPALPEAAAAAILPVATAAPAPEIDWIALAYMMGGTLILLRLALGLFMLHRWTRHAVPVSDPVWMEAIARAAEPLRRPVRLLVSPRVPSPLSLGVTPATILIGPDIERSPDRAAAVVAHEMAHVRRFDWPVMLAARVALALFWFNPLAWLLVTELARQTELAADEDAVTRVARADYAQTLLAVAGGCGAHSACGMAVTRSALGRRIRLVLDAAPRKPASGLLCAALIGSIPLGIAPLAAMQLVEKPYVQVPGARGDLRAALAKLEAQPNPAPGALRFRAAAPVTQERRPVRAPRAVGPERPLLVAPAGPRQEHARLVTPRPANQEHAPLDPKPVPAKPPVPGMEEVYLSGAKARSMVKASLEATKPEASAPPKLSWKTGPDVKAQVAQLIQAAGQLRAAAKEYREKAQDPSLSLGIRQGYRNAAETLRVEAWKLNKQAEQIKGVL
ncbi:beta-lactamase regulating signal transducer with metallopeptidase domain [Sphingomonas kyeonggiensis]|uniref:Beta-lactamase regulating signal transducer with metallopeptidase domain n=1 Tax=Sphingomonas kyeonggiensis TaxID=1268553 RepID=A0A7W7NR16_9SPHN|nr:M56 family metallopeptidase [Sphingomonas kyeonggiensis]MBB4838428.1 beta-lactamase regulating signal transducer with metallopeptidase domain [Sphingomonas kyeonggiensis]